MIVSLSRPAYVIYLTFHYSITECIVMVSYSMLSVICNFEIQKLLWDLQCSRVFIASLIVWITWCVGSNPRVLLAWGCCVRSWCLQLWGFSVLMLSLVVYRDSAFSQYFTPCISIVITSIVSLAGCSTSSVRVSDEVRSRCSLPESPSRAPISSPTQIPPTWRPPVGNLCSDNLAFFWRGI